MTSQRHSAAHPSLRSCSPGYRCAHPRTWAIYHAQFLNNELAKDRCRCAWSRWCCEIAYLYSKLRKVTTSIVCTVVLRTVAAHSYAAKVLAVLLERFTSSLKSSEDTVSSAKRAHLCTNFRYSTIVVQHGTFAMHSISVKKHIRY